MRNTPFAEICLLVRKKTNMLISVALRIIALSGLALSAMAAPIEQTEHATLPAHPSQRTSQEDFEPLTSEALSNRYLQGTLENPSLMNVWIRAKHLETWKGGHRDAIKLEDKEGKTLAWFGIFQGPKADINWDMTIPIDRVQIQVDKFSKSSHFSNPFPLSGEWTEAGSLLKEEPSVSDII